MYILCKFLRSACSPNQFLHCCTIFVPEESVDKVHVGESALASKTQFRKRSSSKGSRVLMKVLKVPLNINYASYTHDKNECVFFAYTKTIRCSPESLIANPYIPKSLVDPVPLETFLIHNLVEL